MKVAIIGGTGKMGKGLARHLAKENSVIIGSRDPARAESAASGIRGAAGADYHGAAGAADVVILAIPYSSIGSVEAIRPEMEGKLVLSIINPLKSEGGIMIYAAGVESAAEQLARLLPRSRVATAFNNVPAGFFAGEVVPPVDILVAAGSKETYEEAARVIRGVKEARPMYVGPLTQARLVEEITALVLNLASLNETRSLTTKFVTRRG